MAPGQEAHEGAADPQQTTNAPAADSMAADTSARVAAILEEAEKDAAGVRDDAEREAESIAEAARREGAALMWEAHRAAQASARKRAERIAELRASIAARSGSLTEGLEGGEVTRLRLEELVATLGEVEEQIMREVATPPPGAEPPAVEADASADADADVDADAGDVPASAAPAAPAPGDEVELPEGAPMQRMPQRAAERKDDARFMAVVMAIEGGERDEVEERLEARYGGNGWDELLDELFGRVDVRA